MSFKNVFFCLNWMDPLSRLTEKIYKKPKNEASRSKLPLTWNLRSKFARLLKQDNNESYIVEHSWHLVCWDLKNRENFKQFFTFEETFVEQLLPSHQTKKVANFEDLVIPCAKVIPAAFCLKTWPSHQADNGPREGNTFVSFPGITFRNIWR